MLSLYTLLALPLVVAAVGSALLSLAVCLHDLLRRRQELPSLHYRESSLNARLLAKCGLRQRVFSPSFWLRSGHLQTLVASWLPRGDRGQEMTFQREYLQMRDKGVVALDWVVSVQPRVKRKSTVLLVLPPVTGDVFTVSALCYLATRRGFRTVVFNRRGHGGSVLTTSKLLSSADPSDLRQVVKYLRLRFPKSRLAAVAYGTGCGLLISYLGEFGSSAILSAGACVSPCYDMAERFSGPLRSVYDLVYLLKLKAILLSHARALSSVVNIRQALNAWSFRSYEESVYFRMYNYAPGGAAAASGHSNIMNGQIGAPASGTVSPQSQSQTSPQSHPNTPPSQSLPPPSPGSSTGQIEEYWERNNPIRDVDDIAVPVLCINSLDDPFYGGSAIPYDLFRCYPNFLLVVTEKGGHCGFLEQFPFHSWADCLCLDYLEAVFDFTTRASSTTSSSATSSSSSRKTIRSTI